ncbi:MAG: thioesterase family protein [Pirellulaceae bacterium]|nr:acyl-CoA thioesterase [Planctomycetales bacterium]
MGQQYHTTRRVEFRDTDAAGIVHFSVYFTFMEQVEHEFLRGLDLSVMHEFEGQIISWPRVAASCDYRRPIRYGDVVDVLLDIERMGDKSVTYRFHFRHHDHPVADGKMTAVCCRMEGSKPKSIAIPSAIVEKLAPYTNQS